MKRLISSPSFFKAICAGCICLATTEFGVSAQQTGLNQRLCAVKGTVTDAVTGQGLRKAFVRLEDLGPGAPYPAVTDDQGMFTIEGIEPGTYVLEAEHLGFVESKYGEATGQAVRLRLTPGETLTDINVKLSPQAVISGRVVDEDGDLWSHANVNLYRSEWERGRPRIRGYSSGEVNDQGEFRIGQIPPGRYYLAAEPNPGWEIRNRPRVMGTPWQRQPTWYPSSLNLDGATAIVLAPGSQLSGLEIRLRRGNVHRIRGTVSGAENVPGFTDRGQFRVPQVSAELVSGGAPNSPGGSIRPDNSFEIQGVPSGTYDVRAHQGIPPIDLGGIRVQVDDRDVDDVSIQLVPPRPLKGVIQTEDKGSMKSSGLTVLLDSYSRGWSQSAVSRGDGSFDFAVVGSERYRVLLKDSSAKGLYVKEIHYGDAKSNDGTVSLTGPERDLVIIVSTRGARLTGTVINSGDRNSTAGASGTAALRPQVVLMPNGQPGESRLGAFDQNGTFLFDNVPPGTYKLYAFEGVPDGVWDDSDFVKQISNLGVDISLAEEESRAVDVRLLLKSDLVPTLNKLGLE